MRRRRAAALVLVAAIVGGAAPARAFSRFQTAGGQAYFWKKSCVPVTVYLNGFLKSSTNHLTLDAIRKSVAAAADAWSVVECAAGRPYVEIVPTFAPEDATPPPVGDDARNTLVFRTESWTKSGRPDGVAYDPKGAAVTHVHAAPDGHVTDADIEVNAVGKQWANLDPNAPPPGGSQQIAVFTDLQNTLTHEFGHLLGLEHNCFRPDPNDPTVDARGKRRWNDERGEPVPDCEAAPPAVVQSVMFDGAMPEEVSKRTLAPDEDAAMCAIYAPTLTPEACELDAAPGCSASSTKDLSPVLVLVAVLVFGRSSTRTARRTRTGKAGSA
jgi:hypothetical protein